MNFMTILIETVILVILFTVAVLAGSRNPVDTVYDMPELIVNHAETFAEGFAVSYGGDSV